MWELFFSAPFRRLYSQSFYWLNFSTHSFYSIQRNKNWFRLKSLFSRLRQFHIIGQTIPTWETLYCLWVSGKYVGHNMEVAQAGRLVGLPYRRPQVWSLMVFLSVVTALHRWTRTNVWLCLSLILMDWGLSWGGPHPGLTLLGHNTHQLYCDPEKYWAAEMVIIYLLFYYYFKWSLQFFI